MNKMKISSNTVDVAQKQFLENILANINEGKQYDPIRKWLKGKIKGREKNQNLYVLKKSCLQKVEVESAILKQKQN